MTTIIKEDYKILTEKEINLVKRRMNNGKKDADFDYSQEYRLDEIQTRKGLDWLMDKWKTPFGKERKNNPYGYREQEALESFEYFTFDGWYDSGTIYGSHYEPIYSVVGAEASFQYVVRMGLPYIIG